MGRLAQANRSGKARLRNLARDAKTIKSRVEADRLKMGRGYLVKLSRKLPRPGDIEELLEDVKSRWDPPDAEKGEAPTKGSAARDTPDKDPRKELLRRIVITSKSLRQLAKQALGEAGKNEEVLAFLSQPCRSMIRAPLPNARFTTAQMSEFLTFAMIMTALVERYARRLKGG